MRKLLFNKPGVIILGLLIMAIGLAHFMGDSRPLCNGHRMNPGDVCKNKSYAQEKDSDDRSSKTLTIAGGVIFVCGAVWAYRSRKKKKR